MYLRDTLLRLAAAATYRPLWSPEILDELERNLAEGLGDETAHRIVELMTDGFVDAVVTGHEPLIPTMTNDEKDRHVLAAAVRSDAAAIVTFNVNDFPPSSTEPFDLDVLHPDEFLANQWDLAPTVVHAVLTEQLAGYRHPPRTMSQLAERMVASGCPRFAEILLET